MSRTQECAARNRPRLKSTRRTRSTVTESCARWSTNSLTTTWWWAQDRYSQSSSRTTGNTIRRWSSFRNVRVNAEEIASRVRWYSTPSVRWRTSFLRATAPRGTSSRTRARHHIVCRVSWWEESAVSWLRCGNESSAKWWSLPELDCPRKCYEKYNL